MNTTQPLNSRYRCISDLHGSQSFQVEFLDSHFDLLLLQFTLRFLETLGLLVLLSAVSPLL